MRQNPRDSASVYAALGDETRLRLVIRLSGGGPLSIASLSADSPLTRQAITKHLRVMENARLVHSARQGRERVWQLDPQRLQEARTYLDTISRQWDNALDRLRSLVEG